MSSGKSAAVNPYVNREWPLPDWRPNIELQAVFAVLHAWLARLHGGCAKASRVALPRPRFQLRGRAKAKRAHRWLGERHPTELHYAARLLASQSTQPRLHRDRGTVCKWIETPARHRQRGDACVEEEPTAGQGQWVGIPLESSRHAATGSIPKTISQQSVYARSGAHPFRKPGGNAQTHRVH